jgi:hypothetical protein
VHTLKAYKESRDINPFVHNLSLDEGHLSASCSGHFTPTVTAPVHIEYLAGWVPESIWIFKRREIYFNLARKPNFNLIHLTV